MAHERRVFVAVIGKPFLAGLAVPVLLALIAVAFVDTNTDWSLVRSTLAAAPQWQSAMAISTLAALWSWMSGRALRRVWLQPVFRFLVRQPLSVLQWTRWLLPNVGIALVPVAAACGLIEPRANVVAHYLIPAAFAWPMVLGASYGGLPLLVTYLGSAILLAAVLTAYLHAAVWLYAALLLLPIVIPLSVAPIRRQSARLDRRRSTRLAALHPIGAMVRRDLLCLVRSERKSFVTLLVWSGLAPAMMLAFRLNGGVAGREALLTAAVFFSLVAATVYYPLERFKLPLGKEFARLRWPVSAFDRALALTLLFGVLLMPSALLIGLFGSTMGYARELAFLSFALTTISIGAWTFARHLRTGRATIGAYLVTLLAHGCVLFSLPGRIYVPLAAMVSALGLLKTTTLLKHHMVDAEITRATVA